MQDNSLVTLRDYGHIRLKLKEIMDEKSINRNAMGRYIGVRFEVIDKWYRGEVERLDLDVLARVCCILECRVEDLLVYEKDSKE